MSKEQMIARQLRLAIIQNLLGQLILTEEDAKELLGGPLLPRDDLTIVDDSGLLNMGEAALNLIADQEA